MTRKSALTLLFILIFAIPAHALDEITFTAGPVQNTLVQLFTSDSSALCNPALQWLNAQRERYGQEGPWEKFVPIEMHVSAWDGDGYKDNYAKKEFGAMLAAYRKKWGVTNV